MTDISNDDVRLVARGPVLVIPAASVAQAVAQHGSIGRYARLLSGGLPDDVTASHWWQDVTTGILCIRLERNRYGWTAAQWADLRQIGTRHAHA